MTLKNSKKQTDSQFLQKRIGLDPSSAVIDVKCLMIDHEEVVQSF